MKQIRNKIFFPVVTLLGSGILTSCVKSDSELNPDSRDRTEIAPRVAVGTSSVEVSTAHNSSAPQTKADVSGNTVLSLYFARADEMSASTYGNYGAAAISATRAAGAGEQSLTFSPVQYYRADGLKTKLTGWHPGGATASGDASGKGYYNGTACTVSWIIDGSQDVMTAPLQQGNRTSAMPTMTFGHSLTQLRFHPYAESQSTIDAWGKITKIEVLNQQNAILYTLTNDATGVVSFSGNATNTFSAGIADGGAALSLATADNKATNAIQMGNAVMIVPQSAADHVLTLRITTADKKLKNLALTQALAAGVPYRLYMNFKESGVTIETAVVQWSDVTTNDKIGEIRVGDFLDGGIVYQVTGSNYKVFSLDQGSNLTWSAYKTYYELGAGDGQDATDGRKNVSAMKAYATKNGMTLSTAFPAAYFCDQKGDGWYIPAKDELKALYNAYQIAANKTAIDAGLANNSGTAFPTTDGFWSGTESYLTSAAAWFVDFADGHTNGNGKGTVRYPVRCIKDI